MAGLLGTISGQVRLDIRPAVAAYAALRAHNARTVYALRGTGDAFVAAGQRMTLAGAGLLYVFGKAVSAAAEFERKMDFFAAVTDTSAEALENLNEFTLQLAKDTIYSADQIADGFVELGKAGVGARQIIDGIGEAVTNLGAAGDIPLADSGKIITSTVQQFDLAAQDAVKVTDLLAGAANASIVDISDLGVSLKYVGGVASAVGLTFEDTTTALSLLGKAGIRGSTAGTSLRQMLVSLGGATGPARESLSELGIMTEDGGNKFFTAAGKAKSLSQIFQILQDSTADLTQKQRLMHLRTIFNNRALSAASILTREGAKGFRQMNKEMTKVTAADVASERLDNLSGDIEILRGNIETLLIEQGGPFQEMFREWTQSITELVQAFADLDPQLQKNIVGAVGMGGAVLFAMGIISLIIGTVFRFLAAMFKLVAAFKFIGRVVLGIGKVIWWAFTRLTPWGKAVAIILAIGQAFYELYQRSERFRDAIAGIGDWFKTQFDKISDAISAAVDWFKQLGDSPGEVWDNIKSGVADAVGAVADWFAQIPGIILGALSAAAGYVATQIGRIVSFFLSLPGKVLGIIQNFVSRVLELLTFKNIGYAMGFLLGLMARLWLNIQGRIIGIVANLVARVIGFFAQLPGRIAAFVVTMVSRAISLFQSLRARAIALMAAAVSGIIGFISTLPGRVASFLARMVASGISNFLAFVQAAREAGPRIVAGIIDFVQNLPSRVAGFLVAMVSRARGLLANFASAALNAGYDIYNGLMDGISQLPGAVAGIIGRMIGAFRGAITSAAAAVRDFAAGMWEGFKDGLGISSPSYIEEAMWQITGVLDKETKAIGRKTMEVQRLSKKMASTQFGVGDTTARQFVTLAANSAATRSRATSLANTLRGPGGSTPGGGGGQKKDRLVEGELELSPSGRAFIRGVAEEVAEDNAHFDSVRGRMG